MPSAAKLHRYPHNERKRSAHQTRPDSSQYVRPDHHAIYQTQRWRRVASSYRKRHPYCEHHMNDGELIQAMVTDHIKPIDQGGAVWDEDNLQALCHECHNRKTAADKRIAALKANPYCNF